MLQSIMNKLTKFTVSRTVFCIYKQDINIPEMKDKITKSK